MVSKAKRLVTGSILGTVSFVLRIGISLYMTPFMIRSFGGELYGLWMLVASFTGFYGLFDFGLATAVKRFLSRALGQKDYEEANKVFNASLIVFFGIGVFSLIFTLIIAGLGHLFVKTSENVILFRRGWRNGSRASHNLYHFYREFQHRLKNVEQIENNQIQRNLTEYNNQFSSSILKTIN